MDKPLCKICGHKHSGVDHVWRTVEGTTPEYVEKIKNIIKARELLDKADVPMEGRLIQPKFDRTKYQREYMRKRRANR